METKIIYCSGCGIEITWSAIIYNDRLFCCNDCSQGVPCACADSVELDTDLSNPQSLMLVNKMP